MTDPSDIEVEPTPEERCSVAIAALSAACNGVVVSESFDHYAIAARVSFGYVWWACEKRQDSLINAAYAIRDNLVTGRMST